MNLASHIVTHIMVSHHITYVQNHISYVRLKELYVPSSFNTCIILKSTLSYTLSCPFEEKQTLIGINISRWL